MILPITAYGDPVLLKKAQPIDKDYPNLSGLINDMFETMYNASGVGIAAPQVGLSIRLFVIDAKPFADDDDDEVSEAESKQLKAFKRVFLNAEILEQTGEKWAFTEGCLSIPDIREEVMRPANIKIKYYDEKWVEHIEEYTGLAARVIQHEYDHIEGKLFTDYLNPLKKAMLRGRLDSITKGAIKVDYKMKFPARKKGRR
ncbi:peptide deformylase [Solitalea canadensis]|uniref:Peptide deformylase n=1 Tax=Solitalea canadensis (strain ATCC 29591 / DSM 3403 / JCM 21819 / LMG 8368 / NBRC 15130 / NCIMB 12057 / USAM 9D) TaxID=929556 RepID=H8KL43_SOLCM|nr:peptide deformylase [Solitalea canadensis]AFD09126.1 peptide deformylase [Solitalea canadensis DSM 3403]